MYGTIKEHLQRELQSIENNGLLKKERIWRWTKSYVDK